MEKQDKYVYPAIFHFDDDGISVEFPDLPGCVTCGKTLEHATYMAKDAAALWLYDTEEEVELVPEPSRTVETGRGEALVLVEVYMPPYRDAIEQKTVRKTLTIPKWLNDEAEKSGANFSRLLSAALKQYLGITQPPTRRKQV